MKIVLASYIALRLNGVPAWSVNFHPAFDAEFNAYDEALQDAILVHLQLLERVGPSLGRPYVDTLNGSKHANMKELRFKAEGGVWRIAFAFDPIRKAVVLVGGDKSGGSETRFYNTLIKKADNRYDSYLSDL